MKILFVYQKERPFVAADLAIISTTHDVHAFQFVRARQAFSLWQATRGCDVVFCWFGKLHAFFAVLFSRIQGKRCIVVAGGDDVANEPDIPYGLLAHPIKRWVSVFIFRYVDLVLAFSEHSRSEAIRNAGADPSKVRRIYLGFCGGTIGTVPGTRKTQGSVLTVGGVRSENLERKGLELFVRSGALLPGCHFTLVGAWVDDSIRHLQAIASPNVQFAGEVTDTGLRLRFSEAKVYVQVSKHEGFGSSLAEAMLCECVPVVSRRGAIPEVVGDCGFYVDELTPEAVAAQIERALASDLGPRARERIVREFPLEKRRQALLAAVNEVAGR